MADFLQHTSDYMVGQIQAWAELQSRHYIVQTIISKYIALHNKNQLPNLPEKAITLLQSNFRNYWTLLKLLQTSTRQQLSAFMQIMLDAKSTPQLSILLAYPLTHEYLNVVHSEADEVAFFTRYGIGVTACEHSYWTAVRADYAAAAHAAQTAASRAVGVFKLSTDAYRPTSNVHPSYGGGDDNFRTFVRFCAAAFPEGKEEGEEKDDTVWSFARTCVMAFAESAAVVKDVGEFVGCVAIERAR